MPPTSAERHAEIAGRFATHAAAVTDWDAPAPVPGWQARDVVDHLVTWLPALLAVDGVDLGPVPPTADDPRAAWDAHAAAVQALLTGSDAGRDFTHPNLGTLPLDQAVDRFYTTDVFLHTWDLAEAAGRPSELPEDTSAELLQGMEPIEELLRSSGQYGPRVAVPANASAVEQLMGFIGRDPAWRS